MSAIVLYSEYEAYRSNWRYLGEQARRSNEAVMRWLRENSAVIDAVIYGILLAWLASVAFRCYRHWCPPAEPPADKKRLRTELAHVENAIKALKDHRTCIIEKLKRD
jgi:hypothetical protein